MSFKLFFEQFVLFSHLGKFSMYFCSWCLKLFSFVFKFHLLLLKILCLTYHWFCESYIIHSLPLLRWFAWVHQKWTYVAANELKPADSLRVISLHVMSIVNTFTQFYISLSTSARSFWAALCSVFSWWWTESLRISIRGFIEKCPLSICIFHLNI